MADLLPVAFNYHPTDSLEVIGRKAIRWHRWRAHRALHKLSSLKAVRECSYREAIHHTDAGPEVAQAVDLGVSDGVASIRGVRRCGGVHSCFQCGPKVRNGRAQEVRQVANRHLAMGGSLVFATFTMRHHAGHRLALLWSTVAGAWTQMRSGGRSKVLEATYGVSGYVRALEVTHGQNGWHPHLHVLLLIDGDLPGYLFKMLQWELAEAWKNEVARHGWMNAVSDSALRIERVRDAGDVAGYVTKVDGTCIDQEMTRADLKTARRKGRTPWQIFRDFLDYGDPADLELWREYEQASKGKNAVTFSRHLRERYAVQVRTDVELAEEQTGHVSWASLDHQSWRLVADAGETSALMQAVSVHDEELCRFIVDWCGGDQWSLRIRPG